MLIILKELEESLTESITIPQEKVQRFFKAKPGEYAHHDKFLGIKIPTLRTIAKKYNNLSLDAIKLLLQSEYNEKRLLALFMLIHIYNKASLIERQNIYDFYMDNIDFVNNWNLVDASAHLIVGRHLFDKDKSPLQKLSKSNNMWHRRIGIVATWYFIRQQELTQTFMIAESLLRDRHDLIHKAVGWMLREAGKKNEESLLNFLEKHHTYMPRTMLRYAIEKLSQQQKHALLYTK